MALNLGTILQAGAAEHPDRPVLRLGERTMSYAELDRAARGVATSLRDRGIQPGDTVALLIPNVPEFTIAYFGILYAGAVSGAGQRARGGTRGRPTSSTTRRRSC